MESSLYVIRTRAMNVLSLSGFFIENVCTRLCDEVAYK